MRPSLVYGSNLGRSAARSLLNGGRAAIGGPSTHDRWVASCARAVGVTVPDAIANPSLRTLSVAGGLLPVGSLVGTSGDADIDASIEKLLRSR